MKYQLPLITLLAPFIIVLTPDCKADDVYRWTDSSGGVHYGSKPPKNNSEVARLPQTPLSRYSPERLLEGYGRANTQDGIQEENLVPQFVPTEIDSPILETGEVLVELDEASTAVTGCEVEVKNTGGGAANDVSVAFEFPHGVVVPTGSKKSIAPKSSVVFAIPSQQLPVPLPDPHTSHTPLKPKVLLSTGSDVFGD